MKRDVDRVLDQLFAIRLLVATSCGFLLLQTCQQAAWRDEIRETISTTKQVQEPTP